MKLAYVVDSCAQNSFYVKDGVGYDFIKHKPYAHNRSINPSLTISSWNFPFLFGDGCFLNLIEWVKEDLDFPDYDLDIILYGCERAGLDNETKHLYSVDRLRKKYPNAKMRPSRLRNDVQNQTSKNSAQQKNPWDCTDVQSQNNFVS